MPHCFDPKDGEESVVMLGAPHGATAWRAIHAVHDVTHADRADLTHDDLVLDGTELRARIPFAGTFCAFSSPEVLTITITPHLITITQPALLITISPITAPDHHHP